MKCKVIIRSRDAWKIKALLSHDKKEYEIISGMFNYELEYASKMFAVDFLTSLFKSFILSAYPLSDVDMMPYRHQLASGLLHYDGLIIALTFPQVLS